MAAAASLSSIPRSSTSMSSSSLPFHARINHQTFHLSPKLKSPKPLKVTSQPFSLPLLRLFSPAGLFRSAAASDDLQAAVEDADEGESELSGSETDQLLEQEQEEEEELEGEGEGNKSPASPEDGRLYVGNLPFSFTASQLTEVFAGAGAVRSVEIIYDRVTDRSRGFAFVTMETVEDAENAIRMFDSSQIGGRTVKVNFPQVPKGGEKKVLEPKIKSSYQSFVDTANKVYAGNLSWSVTSQGLREAFSDQPGFVSAMVIFERGTTKSRGFGFISFSSDEDARSAITAMNGVDLAGRPLRLNMASERSRPSPPSSVDSSSEETATVEESEGSSSVDPSSEETATVDESEASPSLVDSSSEETGAVEESEVLSGVSS